MDDLLKAFQVEVSQGLDACEADLDRLRKSPEAAEAAVNLHRLFCSIREMSVVLGQNRLAAVASRAAGALDAAKAGGSGVLVKTVPIVSDYLARIRKLLHGLAPADSGPSSQTSPTPGAADETEPAAGSWRPTPPEKESAVLALTSRKPARKATGFAPAVETPPALAVPPAADEAQGRSSAADDRAKSSAASTTPAASAPGPVPPAPRRMAAEVAASRRSAPLDESVARARRPRRARRRWYRPRNVLLATGGSLAAAVAAASIVVLSADPNDYRGDFEATIRSATGRDVTIGEIRFAVSLAPTVVLEDVTLANAEWSSQPVMVTARRLEVSMALIPLFRGEFEAKRFALHGADILLESDAQGRGNWVFGTGDDDAVAGGSDEPASLPQVGKLTINESRLIYRDGMTGESESFEIRRLTARRAGAASMLQIDVDSSINGQAAVLSGTVGGLGLLDGRSPYPVDVRGEVAGLQVAVVGEVAEPLQGRGFALAVTAAGESLAGLGSMIAAELPPGGPIRLTTTIDDVEGGIRLRGVNAAIGQSNATGDVTLRPGVPNWRIDARLASSQIDLRDFAPPGSDADAGAADPRLFSAGPLPYRWIGKIDIAATLAADRVIRGDTILTAAALEGGIESGKLSLASLRFGYVGGEVVLTGSLDITPRAPAWRIQATARRLAAGEALQRLLGLDTISGGRGDLDANLAASGRSLRELAMTLGGDATLSVTDARIVDDLMKLFLTDLTRAVSLRDGGTRLRCLTTKVAFAKGIGRSRHFVADAGAAVVVGAGNISLRNETIDMRFEPVARDVSLAALEVPVRVSGPLADPNVTPTPDVVDTAAGLADTVLGLVGADGVLDRDPTASCAVVPDAAKSQTTTKSKSGTGSGQPPTTTQQAQGKPKKQKRTSTTGQILDDAGDVIDNIGDSIGDLFN